MTIREQIIRDVKWYRSHYGVDCEGFTRDMMKRAARDSVQPGEDLPTAINMIDEEVNRFYGKNQEKQEMFVQGVLF